jgi:hypothetical protein
MIPRLPRRLRKTVLTVHVVASVGWLGLDIGLLTLGVVGVATADATTMEAAYLAMGIFADRLIVPVSVATVASGLVLAVATPWGLLRYYWVAAKFGMTLVAATASIFALRARIGEAVAAVNAPHAARLETGLGDIGFVLVVAPTVALIVYTTATALSVFKPWGRIRGRRAPKRGAPASTAARVSCRT